MVGQHHGSALGRGNEAFDIYRRICPAYLEEESVVHVQKTGTRSMTVNGRPTEGDLAPLFPGKEQVLVEVTV